MNAINVTSEIAPLKKVLLHRPGNELLNLTPNNLNRLLFDDIPFLPIAQEEHDEFAHILKENDIEVVYLEDLMAEVLELIKEIADKGMTMIIVSHEMNFVKKCANKVVFMDGGKISFSGTVEEVFNNKDNIRLKDFLSKTNK